MKERIFFHQNEQRKTLINKFTRANERRERLYWTLTSSLPLTPFNRHSNSRLNQLVNTRTTKREGEEKTAKEKQKLHLKCCCFVCFLIDTWEGNKKKSNIIWKSRVGWRAMVQQGKQTKRCIESSNVDNFNRPSFFWGWRNLPWWVSTKRSLQLPVQPALREPTGRVSCAFGIQWSFWACQPDRRRQRLDQLGQRRATVAILRRR